MRIVYRLLFALHGFVGLGAVVGGVAAIINPQGPLGMSVKSLRNSPFNDYLIPGIILLFVIGFGNIISALMFHFKQKFQGYISSVFSLALIIWIVVQCIVLNAVVFMHILFFTIGLMELVLSIVILFEKRLFPTNIILNFYKKAIKEKN